MAVAETDVRRACEGGDLAAAVTAALQLYGSELFSFLASLANNHDLAAEAFSELGEDLWLGIQSFRWQSSLRSWLYTLARNALNQLRRDPRRRRDRNLPISIAPELAVVVRTVTREIQRTEVKDELRVLRDQLEPEEHELLLLRLDRELSWKEIARIVGGERDLESRAAALRKQFERVKDRLKRLALAHGLI